MDTMEYYKSNIFLFLIRYDKNKQGTISYYNKVNLPDRS